MITVDQERMKEYIGMGFDKEEAFKMCKEEADALNKEEAKAAKAAAKEPEPTPGENNDTNNEGDNTQFIKKDEVNNIVKDTIKGLKDDEEFKNFLAGGDAQKEEPKTMDSVVANAVEKMRTGKYNNRVAVLLPLSL